MKISLILPLFDRRNAGWKSLESALAQTIDRDRFEVIVVAERAFLDQSLNDPQVAPLLQRCDAVVRVDADPSLADQEIPCLLAGYQRSVGDVLFFMEGHTVLVDNCCAMIAAYFRDNPHSPIAWAPRIYYSETSLGTLIGMHGKGHEQRAWERGGFWLGANSVITRGLFERLGGLEAGYMRFCERVLFERVARERVAVGRISAPLAIHYDDMSLSQLIGVATATGEAKFRYYNFPMSGPGAGPVQVRHRIYLYANHAGMALVLFPLAWVLRAVFLRAAVGMSRMNRAWAYQLYSAGLGFADLSGFCKARLRAARSFRGRARVAAPESSGELA